MRTEENNINVYQKLRAKERKVQVRTKPLCKMIRISNQSMKSLAKTEN